jgi:hypothetical protein
MLLAMGALGVGSLIAKIMHLVDYAFAFVIAFLFIVGQSRALWHQSGTQQVVNVVAVLIGLGIVALFHVKNWPGGVIVMIAVLALGMGFSGYTAVGGAIAVPPRISALPVALHYPRFAYLGLAASPVCS